MLHLQPDTLADPSSREHQDSSHPRGAASMATAPQVPPSPGSWRGVTTEMRFCSIFTHQPRDGKLTSALCPTHTLSCFLTPQPPPTTPCPSPSSTSSNIYPERLHSNALPARPSAASCYRNPTRNRILPLGTRLPRVHASSRPPLRISCLDLSVLAQACVLAPPGPAVLILTHLWAQLSPGAPTCSIPRGFSPAQLSSWPRLSHEPSPLCSVMSLPRGGRGAHLL